MKIQMKLFAKFLIFCLAVLSFFPFAPDCFANSVSDEFFSSDAVDIIGEKASGENIDKVYGGFDFAEFTKEILNGNVFQPKKIVGKAVKILFGAAMENAHMLVVLIALALAGGIISNLQSSFNAKSTAETAFFAFYTMYSGILTVCVYNCLESARQTVEAQSAFLQAATPTYIGMMIASGSVLTSAASKPVILYFISLISIAVKDFFIPFSFMIFILSVINNLSGKMHITKLVSLLRLIVTKSLTALMTVFVTLLTLSGMSAQSADTLSVRAAKYAAPPGPRRNNAPQKAQPRGRNCVGARSVIRKRIMRGTTRAVPPDPHLRCAARLALRGVYHAPAEIFYRFSVDKRRICAIILHEPLKRHYGKRGTVDLTWKN